MTRWEPGAADRLERSALELFATKGFAETTVPEIAAGAGLTTRAFHRYYADKREVLFRGEDDVVDRVGELLARAPEDLPPMQLALWGVRTMATELFADQRDHMRARRAIVATDDGLVERELRKQRLLAGAIAAALERRGLGATEAVLAARLTVLLSSTAIERWLTADDDRSLLEHVEQTAAELASRGAELAPES